MICIICEHDCHCGDSCEARPMDGGCGCPRCEHEGGENMIEKLKKVWQKVIDWLWK